MRIQHGRPHTTRMEQLPDDAFVRLWFDDRHFITVQAINNDEAVAIDAYQAPGGGSYRESVRLQPNGQGIVITKPEYP
jgi:hypothetical protein